MLTYEEIEKMNGWGANRRKWRCRRDRAMRFCILWSGWLVAGLTLLVNLLVNLLAHYF